MAIMEGQKLNSTEGASNMQVHDAAVFQVAGGTSGYIQK